MIKASSASRARRVSCQALPAPPVWHDLPSQLPFAQEIMAESGIPISAIHVAQCEARFGSSMLSTIHSAAAPSIVISETLEHHPADGHPLSKDMNSARVDFVSSPSLGDAKSLAACLATPSEAVPESEAGTRGRLVATSSLRGTVIFQFQEEVTQCVDRWSDWVRRIRRKRRNLLPNSESSLLS